MSYSIISRANLIKINSGARSLEGLTDNTNPQHPNNALPIPERPSKTHRTIQTNNQPRHTQPKPKRPRTRTTNSAKNNRHKTTTKHLQPNRKRKNNRQTTKRNRTTHNIDTNKVQNGMP